MAVETFRIITSRVGTGGQTKGIEVKRIEELLWWATPKKERTFKTPNGTWDAKSAAAMLRFQKVVGGPLGWTAEEYIEPDDQHMKLLWLAMTAGVVSRTPGSTTGASAAVSFYRGVDRQVIPYGWTEKGVPIRGGTRIVRGWEGNPFACVYTTANKLATSHFTLDYPATLNCSSFANLMLSVYYTGGCHAGSYTPWLNVGGFVPLGKRYGLVPLQGNVEVDKKLSAGGVFSDLDKLRDQLLRDKIYHFAKYKAGKGITHDMVLLNEVVYESNKCDEGKSSLRETTLEKRAKSMISPKNGSYIQVLGPAGTTTAAILV